MSRPSGFTGAQSGRPRQAPIGWTGQANGGRSPPPAAAGQHGPGPVKPGGSRPKVSVSGGFAAGQPRS